MKPSTKAAQPVPYSSACARRRNTHKQSGAGEGSFSLEDSLAVGEPGREGSKESARPRRADECERVRCEAATCG